MKYRVTRGRWDEPMSVYDEFDAEDDTMARQKFGEMQRRPENTWDTMFLYRIDQPEIKTLLTSVRVPH